MTGAPMLVGGSARSLTERIVAVALPLAWLASCGGGGGPPPPPPPCTIAVSSGFSGALDWVGTAGSGSGADGQGGVGIQVSLSVSPVVGAQVTVRKSDGTVLGTAATGSDGRATFKSCDMAGPFLVEAEGVAGASYFDPAIRPAGAAAPFGEGERLRAIVPALTANIAITPWTEAVVQRLIGAPSATPQALPAAAAIDDALRDVRDNVYRRWLPDALAVDSLTMLPATTTSATLADRAADRYALALAALGHAAAHFNATLPAPSLAAARQLALDSADDRIDGRDAGGASVAAVEQTAYAPGALRQALDLGIAVAASQYATTALRDRLPATLALGAVALPDGGGARVVRLSRDGTVVLLNADGSAGTMVASDALAVYSASQAPASALFVQNRDGTVVALGDGGTARLLGLGTGQSVATATAVAALRDVTSISIGAAHALARKADGSVLGWGDATRGGLMASAGVLSPQTLPGVAQAIAVLALNDLSFALQHDGRVLAWGTGAAALGSGGVNRRTQPTPQLVTTATGGELGQVQALAGFANADEATLAALRADGTVWTWGDNTRGGLGVSGGARSAASVVPSLSDIVGLAATDRGFLAVDAAGVLYFWGSVPLSGAAGAPTAYSEPLAPRRLDGLPAVRTVQPAFAGLYQARLYMRDSDRWQTDGVGARQTTPASELDVVAIGGGILTIAPISGDGVVNAAERSAGVVVSGTINEANRPVTVQVGATAIAAQVSGTAWTATLPPSLVPSTGSLTVSASFTSSSGVPSAPTSRTFSVDAVAPALTISDNVSGVGSGPVTFTFTWTEPPVSFGPDSVAVTGGTRGSFVQLSATTYTLQVTPPSDSVGNITVTIAAGAVSDAVGNPSAGPVSATQAFKTDLTPPTLTITDNSGGLAIGPVTLTFTWSEPVTGFAVDDVSVTNATKGPLNAIDARTFSMLLTPPAQSSGTISVTVAAGSVRDRADNPSVASFARNLPFDTNIVSYDYSGGPGPDGAGGGSAGDGGTPGNLPGVFSVTAERVGSNLRLAWARHSAVPPCTDGGTHDDFCNVAYYLVLQRDPGSSSHPGELTKFARILVTGSTPPNATFNVLLSGANPTASYRIRACNAGSGVDPDPTDEDNPGGVKDQNWCRDSTEEFMTDGTPVVSIDFSAGPAPVDAADGSAAGVAGTPGVLPSAFSITAERVESVVSFGEKNLRLVWDRHAPVSACGSNPVAYCNVAYYLVLKRDPFDFSNPDELTKFAYIRMTAGTPSNARFAVQLSTENDSFSYRIRACNGGSGQPGVGGTADQSWCRDSNQEFNADGTPRP